MVLSGKELHNSLLLSHMYLLPESSRFQVLYPKGPEPFSYILLAAGIFQEHLFTHGQSLTISIFVFIAAAIF